MIIECCYKPPVNPYDLETGGELVISIKEEVDPNNLLFRDPVEGLENFMTLIAEEWSAIISDIASTQEYLAGRSKVFILLGKLAEIQLDFDRVGDPGSRIAFPPEINGIPRRVWEADLGELDLDVRTYSNLVRKLGRKLGPILEKSEEQLLNIPNFGPASLQKFREALEVKDWLQYARSNQPKPS